MEQIFNIVIKKKLKNQYKDSLVEVRLLKVKYKKNKVIKFLIPIHNDKEIMNCNTKAIIRIMKNTKYLAALMLIGGLHVTSCLDADLDDALEYEKFYTTATDADNAVLGIYSSFMRMAGQMVVLNELRGDLMDLTLNSEVDLQEIDANSPSKNNSYADSTPYYNVIANCNDALANFAIMYEKKRLNETQFLERYSDVLAMRCYVYLQLIAQFGKEIGRASSRERV